MPHWPNLFSEDTFAPIFHIMECEFKLTTYRHPNSYCIMCPLHLFKHEIWGNIWKDTVKKSQTSAVSVILFCILLFMGPEDTSKNNQWKKSNKCSQCNYSSSHAGHLRRHLKTHSGEKSNKCSQCDFTPSEQDHWGNIWKDTDVKND